MDSDNKKLISVDEIQKEFISASKKKIRNFMKSYLPVKRIGGRMYVERERLIQLLGDDDREEFPLFMR